MRLGIALVALVFAGCSEPMGMASGLDPDTGAPAIQGDGGFEPGDPDAQLEGFGEDAGHDAAAPIVAVDAGVDAGQPCYPAAGLEGSVIDLECDACPESGCLPVIWKTGIGSGTASGEPGIVSASALLSTALYAHRQAFDMSDSAQAVVVSSGELFDHLHQGQPLAPGFELTLDREPWLESGDGAPGPGNTAVPSYIRIAALVTPTSAVFVWTMHRAPD
jgi:hypothetical protein